MKLYKNKISFLLLLTTILFVSCETEESLNITEPDAKFELNSPGISTVFLNFALPDNPAFTISWADKVGAGTSYNIEMATDAEFTSPVTLGSTSDSTYTMTVNEFNAAIANTGVTSFKDIAIYIRISAGSQVTNSILLLVTTYPVNAPEINNINNGDTFTLSLENNSESAITVEWADPILNSSLDTEINYVLETAAANTSFAVPIEAGNVANENSITLTNSQLNGAAIQSGIAPETTGDLDLRIIATIVDTASGTVLERISETVTISVTTYVTALDLSTTWGVVGSGANDWGATPDLPFFSTDTDGILVAYVNLIDGEIKFRENNAWDNDFGDNDADGTLDGGGANIAVTAGSYKITMDLNNLTYTIEAFSLGIVGGAYNDWGATPDFMLEYDQYSDVFRGIVTLIDGEMKFRMNNAWDNNYGDDNADGTLEPGSANIVVTAGIYIATVSLKDLTYTLEPITNVWGLVGGAYNEWGATPDAQFNRDWSRPFDDVWILNNVTLIDGEYKFRANNAWDTNYGDDGGDGVLELNGGNLVTTAGTYSFVLDFSDPANPTYTKN